MNHFVGLQQARDPLRRGQRMKVIDIETFPSKSFGAYNYLRVFYLKKLLRCSFWSNENKKLAYIKRYLSSDFEYELVRSIYKPKNYEESILRKFSHPQNSQEITKDNSKSIRESFIKNYLDYSNKPCKFDEVKTKNSKLTIEFNEQFTRFINIFDVELVTIYGAIFGILTLSSLYIYFRTVLMYKKACKLKE